MRLTRTTRQFVATAGVAVLLMASGTNPAAAFDGKGGGSGSSGKGGGSGNGGATSGASSGATSGASSGTSAGTSAGPSAGTSSGSGGTSGGSGGTRSLKTVAIPVPPDLANYVTDQNALVVLGKSLFWDMQVGNDGKQACASCHFHAGADHRRTNQLHGNGSGFPELAQEPHFPFVRRHHGGLYRSGRAV